MSHEINLDCGHTVSLPDVEQYMTLICPDCGQVTEIEMDGDWD